MRYAGKWEPRSKFFFTRFLKTGLLTYVTLRYINILYVDYFVFEEHARKIERAK